MKRIILFVLSAILLLSLVSCKQDVDTTESGFLTSTSTVGCVVLSNLVEGTDIIFGSLSSYGTGCMHDRTLTTDDMKCLAKSDALIMNGAGFEGFADKLGDSMPKLTTIVLSDGANIDAEEHDHDGHDHSEGVHFWMSVSEFRNSVSYLAGTLEALFPDEAERIAQNAANYDEKLADLGDELAEILADCNGRSVIATAGVFDCLFKEFGIEIAGEMPHSEDGELSAANIAKLTDIAKSGEADAVFVDGTLSDAVVDLLADQTGLPVIRLSTVVDTETTDKDAYHEIMRINATAIAEAMENR